MIGRRQGASAALLAVSLVAGSATAARADYQEGIKAFRAGDLERATHEFMLEVETAPNYDFGWYMLGMIAMKRQDYSQAEEHLKKAIDLSPNKFSYYNGLATLAATQKDYQKAQEILLERQGLAETAREKAALYTALGQYSSILGNHADAVQYLELARTNPPKLDLLYQLGVAYNQLGDFDKAISTLKEGTAIDGDDIPTVQMLCNAMITKAQILKSDSSKMALYDEILPYARKLVLLDGKDYQNHNILARALFGARRYSDSLASFEKVLELKPDYCFAYANIGKVFLSQEQFETAERSLRKGLECNPKDNITLELLGSTLENMDKLDGSLQAYVDARAIRETPTNIEGVERLEAKVKNRDLELEQARLDKEAAEQYQKELEAYEKQQKALDEYYNKDKKDQEKEGEGEEQEENGGEEEGGGGQEEED